MYGSTATDISSFTIASPSTAMNPSSTEHDFRFPRRPFDSAAGSDEADRSASAYTGISGSNPATDSSPGDLRLQELNLDLSSNSDSTHRDLLDSSVFPNWPGSAAASKKESLDQMQQDDPLATQIWRFFSKTKQSLPSQERMENLTWRMMHMKLRQQQQREAEERAREMARYVYYYFPISPRKQSAARTRQD